MPSDGNLDLVGRAPGGRKLIAIVYADMAAYSHLVGLDDAGTASRLGSLRSSVIDPLIREFGGLLVQTGGDSLLITFDSIDGAMNCAVKIQQQIPLYDLEEPPDRRMRFRIGVNIGDVIADGTNLHGGGVNVAARLQAVCPVGGVCVSRAVYEHVRDKFNYPFEELGPLSLKNISRPVEAFVLRPGVDEPADDSIGVTPETDIADPFEQHETISNQQTRALLLNVGVRPSVAILPFRAIGVRSLPQYLGDGFVQDIIGALASLKDLLVISRGSTLSYRNLEVDARKIGEQLGVKYVLSGTIQRRSRHLHVTAELAEAETANVLWSQRYDGESADLYNIQDEITAQIVNTIAPKVRQAEINKAFQKRPGNMTSYDCYLRALDLIYRLQPDDFEQAKVMVSRAIVLDDSFAAAYALAAEWHGLRVGQGWSTDPQADSAEAIRLAEASVMRDGTNALALAVLGHHKSYLFREYEIAVALFERAIAASPSHATAWGLSAPTYSYVGQPAAALARAKHALRLSPQDPRSFWFRTSICIAYYTLGDYGRAIEVGREALADNPRYATVLRTIAASLAAMGRIDEAHVAGHAVLAREPGFRAREYADRYPYRDPGLRERLYNDLVKAGLPR